MAKSKNSISSEKPKKKYKHKLHEITLSDGTKVMERYHKERIIKPVHPPVKKDPEAGPTPKDDAAKHKYPPPKKDKIFRKHWMKFIDSVIDRDNFREAHLASLEVLCDLYVEYEDFSKILRTEGRTYETVNQWGKTKKINPAVGQLEKVRANIAKYTKQLDLFPKKDTSQGGDGEEDAWE